MVVKDLTDSHYGKVLSFYDKHGKLHSFYFRGIEECEQFPNGIYLKIWISHGYFSKPSDYWFKRDMPILLSDYS